jgi:hypothetical protein
MLSNYIIEPNNIPGNYISNNYNQLEVANNVASNIVFNMKKILERLKVSTDFCSNQLSYSPKVFCCRGGWIRTSDQKFPNVEVTFR